eukprot:CAMPEP_0204113064 /NCGR_PEP_ID=MMETSP0361-20130328/3432_1 /ASSEMBLY_ACC=CAM_ASM_000343 /TAXON_ID=268821 /ORGANISM="Scrippsiella Hangoei, Strain SHTV-5" /LENGTH=458 /DNA_ID=CAMNT_0051063369 /DNA_START=33 /DNA_END=1409 /DNA_ORIENTATION=-
MADILDGTIVWSPESPSGTPGAAPFSALSLTLKRSASRGNDHAPVSTDKIYRVPHYEEAAVGRAFGPFNLEQILRFCHNLGCHIATHGKVCLHTPASKPNDRTNAAVLVGAYLVLCRKWSPEQAAEALGIADAQRKFVCSFAACAQEPEPARTMSVADCWAGLALARDHGWIDLDCIGNEVLLDRACSKYRLLSDWSDAAWLIPGSLMVCADPVTTAIDPNPRTFKSVFPLAMDPFAFSKVSPRSDVSTTSGTRSDQPSVASSLDTLGGVDLESQDPGLAFALDICNDHEGVVAPDHQIGPIDWVSVLHESNVGIVLRTNSMIERGMAERSYDASQLPGHGIEHLDVTLEDGSTPSPSDLRRALSFGRDVMAKGEQAVLVHCKGGFGRSVLMACCLIIDRLDVPGAALLGWVRIARPGAINTVRQELFLRRMQGRAALRKFASCGTHNSCGPGQCTVQ